MLTEYLKHVEERAADNLPPLPLNAEQTAALVELAKRPLAGQHTLIERLLVHRVPAGVDEAAYVKAAFLSDVARGKASSPLIEAPRAVELLGTMQGGYNIQILAQLLDEPELAQLAAEQLKHSLLVFDAFHDVAERAGTGNAAARAVLQSWAEGEWFTQRPAIAAKLTLAVFKVPGETNTDDLSPAPDAWSRPDTPLHARAMLKMPRPGIDPQCPGEVGPLAQIAAIQTKGYPVAYVGDVVGTGSSRKSATNSLLWFFGRDVPYLPNKRAGGFCFASKIAPIFYNTMEDAGALPIEFDVSSLNMGDIIDLYPFDGKVCKHGSEEVLATFSLKTTVLLDEVRAGGRIPLIVGRALTERARAELGMGPSELFQHAIQPDDTGKGYTLAQKIIGKACGKPGVRPGTYCEPKMTTVGSQDTTGPMTRDELKDLACLGFSADLVMQSFCHTAAYPKPVDVVTHHTLPDFMRNRGGVALQPGDGIIHSWLNRMLLPDTVGTGGDSHTRFPIGLSFPAGSGLVAFAAATGVMPLDVPESVLVRFSGTLQPGITLRDLVHAIPYFAIRQGLLSVEKQGKVNVFSGRILEIEGLDHLTVEQAFELSDASAERSAAGCTIKLPEAAISKYLKSNVALLRWMITEGYGDARTLERRACAMEAWLEAPALLQADEDAEYAAVLEIDLDTIREPILCAPNDPDDARLLSEVAGSNVDEVFIGSCMTNIGHFRAAGKLLQDARGKLPTRLWLSPPTRMDEHQLIAEGIYKVFKRVGARTEVPGCSLCMGNQARVAAGATVVSTSTRNFPNRLGDGANVYLASAELAAVVSILGRLPSPSEYAAYAERIEQSSAQIYDYLSFDQMANYRAAQQVRLIEAIKMS